MGAWNEGNFDIDDASDWVYSLEKSKGIDTLLAPINKINSSAEYLESPDCSEALAAAEVIAASLTGDSTVIPEDAGKWLQKKQVFWVRSQR